MIKQCTLVGSVALFPIVDETEHKIVIHLDGIDDVFVISLEKLRNLFAAAGEMLHILEEEHHA